MDRRGLLKIALAAALASFVAWIYVSGAYESLDPATMRVWFREAGPWGGAFFIAAYTVLQPLGVNGLVFLLSAPLVWAPTEAFLLNWAGTVGTGLFSFFAARFVARDWIQRRLPKRIRRFDDRLYTRGFRTVFLLRLIFYTAPTVQWALGASRVSFLPFLAGTVLGVGPLGIVPEYRGRGWGLALIDTVLTHYRDRGLDRAIIDWTDLPGYYEQLGFEIFESYEYAQRSLQ